MQIQSRTIKASLIAFGDILAKSISLISLAILTRVLTLDDYATYKQTILAYDFILPLLVLGLPDALYYFLPGEKKRVKAILIENLFLLFLMGGAFSLFLMLGGNKLLALRFNNPNLVNALLYLIPLPLFMLPASASTACLIARDQTLKATLYNIFSKIIILGTLIVVVLIWRTSIAALIGYVIGAALVLFPALLLMYTSCNEGDWRPSFKSMIAQIKYSGPLGISRMINTISISLDKMIVSMMCSTQEFAIYVNGAIEIPIISTITGSIMVVLIPEMTKLYKSGSLSEAHQLWKRAASKTALILIPIMAFLLVMAPELMRFLFSSKYSNSAIAFRIYLMLLPLRIVSWGATLVAAGKSRLILFMTVIHLALNIIFSILLVKYIGYLGAAIATVIVVYLWNIPYFFVSISKLYNVKFRDILPFATLGKIFVVAIISGTIVFAIKSFISFNDFISLALNGVLYSAITLGLMFKLNLIGLEQLKSLTKKLGNKFSSRG